MHHVLRVHVIAGAEQLLKILFSHVFTEHLVLLLGYLVEQLSPANVLHHQVDELLVDVRFVVLDDVWMVELRQNLDLLLDGIQVVLQLSLVKHLDCNLMLHVVLVVGQEHLSKCSRSENLRVTIYLIILLQLLGALFLTGNESPLGLYFVARLSRKAIAHF